MKRYSILVGSIATFALIAIFEICWFDAKTVGQTNWQLNQPNSSWNPTPMLMAQIGKQLITDIVDIKDKYNENRDGISDEKKDIPDLREANWFRISNAPKDDGTVNGKEDEEENEGTSGEKFDDEEYEGGFDRLWDVVSNG